MAAHKIMREYHFFNAETIQAYILLLKHFIFIISGKNL